jgi:molybdopterin-guanine dinucleotide biosynthesis protein B
MRPEVVAIVGRSGVGKTYLVQSLLRKLTEAGLTVDTIKHTHHPVVKDTPGTDSNLHKAAGARRTVLTGPGFCTVFTEEELALKEVLKLSGSEVDLVLVEGFKNEAIRKIEVVSQGQEPLLADDQVWMTVTSEQGEEVVEAIRALLEAN